MKLNKLLLTSCLVPIAVIPAMVSCNNQPTKTEYELAFYKEGQIYKPAECVIIIEKQEMSTVTLLANVNYTFTVNTVEEKSVQGFVLYDSTQETIILEDICSKIAVKYNGDNITQQGEYRQDGAWYFYKGSGKQILGKIEVSITLTKTINCVPVIGTDV